MSNLNSNARKNNVTKRRSRFSPEFSSSQNYWRVPRVHLWLYYEQLPSPKENGCRVLCQNRTRKAQLTKGSLEGYSLMNKGNILFIEVCQNQTAYSF